MQTKQQNLGPIDCVYCLFSYGICSPSLTCKDGLSHALLGDIVTMQPSIQGKGSLKHEARDVVLPLKLDLPPLQLFRREVRLCVGDLDVGVFWV